MQAGSLYIIRSTPAQHFTEALAQNAESFEALTLPAGEGAASWTDATTALMLNTQFGT